MDHRQHQPHGPSVPPAPGGFRCSRSVARRRATRTWFSSPPTGGRTIPFTDFPGRSVYHCHPRPRRPRHDGHRQRPRLADRRGERQQNHRHSTHAGTAAMFINTGPILITIGAGIFLKAFPGGSSPGARWLRRVLSSSDSPARSSGSGSGIALLAVAALAYATAVVIKPSSGSRRCR
jgi:hypothetical protein